MCRRHSWADCSLDCCIRAAAQGKQLRRGPSGRRPFVILLRVQLPAVLCLDLCRLEVGPPSCGFETRRPRARERACGGLVLLPGFSDFVRAFAAPCGRSDRSIRAALSILFVEFADYTFVLVAPSQSDFMKVASRHADRDRTAVRRALPAIWRAADHRAAR